MMLSSINEVALCAKDVLLCNNDVALRANAAKPILRQNTIFDGI